MKGEKKSPDAKAGAKTKTKAYKTLSVVSMIIALMCLIVDCRDGYQDFAITALTLSHIMFEEEIRQLSAEFKENSRR